MAVDVKDIDTSQAEFQNGSLTDTEADAGNYLRLTDMNVLSFDDASDYVVIPLAAYPSGNYITIEFWFYGTPDAYSLDNFFTLINDPAGDRAIGIFLPYGGTVYWDCGYTGGSIERIFKSISEADYIGWHHWAFVKDINAGEMKIFLDGVQWQSGTGKTASISPDSIDKDVGLKMGEFNLCEMRIWDTARTQTQIQDNMYKSLNGNESGLVAYYKFDEGTGTTATDSAGPNDGSINGASWLAQYVVWGSGDRISPQLDLSVVETVKDSSIDWTEQYTQDVLYFYETNDNVNCGGDASLDITNKITLEGWIYLSDPYGDRYDKFIIKGGSFGGSGYGLFHWRSASGRGVALRLSIGGTEYNAETGETLNPEWTHVAGVYDGSEMFVYVNGQQKAVNSVSGNIDTNTDDLYLGVYYLHGFMSSVRIWNIARTQSEIQSNMHKRLIGNETNLVSYWPINEGSGTTVYDKAGSNDGTINGAAWTTDDLSEVFTDEFAIGTAVRISTDNGSNWTSWTSASNGGSIPGLSPSDDVSNGLLECKQALATSDPTCTPGLASLILRVNSSKSHEKSYPLGMTTNNYQAFFEVDESYVIDQLIEDRTTNVESDRDFSLPLGYSIVTDIDSYINLVTNYMLGLSIDDLLELICPVDRPYTIGQSIEDRIANVESDRDFSYSLDYLMTTDIDSHINLETDYMLDLSIDILSEPTCSTSKSCSMDQLIEDRTTNVESDRDFSYSLGYLITMDIDSCINLESNYAIGLSDSALSEVTYSTSESYIIDQLVEVLFTVSSQWLSQTIKEKDWDKQGVFTHPWSKGGLKKSSWAKDSLKESNWNKQDLSTSDWIKH